MHYSLVAFHYVHVVKLLVAIVFVVPNVIAAPSISGHAGEITLALDDQQNDGNHTVAELGFQQRGFRWKGFY